MIGTAAMSTTEHTKLETLHEADALAGAGNHYDASVARARAAFIGKLLGWGAL